MSSARTKRTLAQLLLLLLAVSFCQGRGSGAPTDACQDMTPRHLSHQPQPEASFPYQLEVNPTIVHPGGRVTLTISPSAPDTADIEGFFVQARRAGTDSPVPLGQFVEIDDQHRTVDCGGEAATGVTHNSKAPKQSVAVTWQAPNDLDSDVVFLASVVQELDTFWAGVRSDTVTLAEGAEPEPEPTAEAEPEPEPTAEPEPHDHDGHQHDDHQHDDDQQDDGCEDGDDDCNAAVSARAGLALMLAPLMMVAVYRLQ